MKSWFYRHRDKISLGISYDGVISVQNFNRTNSAKEIDLGFFLRTWPNLYVKMTVSTYSIEHLAESVLYLESRGFKIHGLVEQSCRQAGFEPTTGGFGDRCSTS